MSLAAAAPARLSPALLRRPPPLATLLPRRTLSSSPPPSHPVDPIAHAKHLVRAHDPDAFLAAYFFPAGRPREAFWAYRALNVRPLSLARPSSSHRPCWARTSSSSQLDAPSERLTARRAQANTSPSPPLCGRRPAGARDDRRDGDDARARRHQAPVVEGRRARHCGRASGLPHPLTPFPSSPRLTFVFALPSRPGLPTRRPPRASRRPPLLPLAPGRRPSSPPARPGPLAHVDRADGRPRSLLLDAADRRPGPSFPSPSPFPSLLSPR